MTGRCHETFKAHPQPNSGPAGLASPLEPIAPPLPAIHWITGNLLSLSFLRKPSTCEPAACPVPGLFTLFLSCSARPERAGQAGVAGVNYAWRYRSRGRARILTDGPVPARKIDSRADTSPAPMNRFFFFFASSPQPPLVRWGP